jgi:hypothetical protein
VNYDLELEKYRQERERLANKPPAEPLFNQYKRNAEVLPETRNGP